VSLYDAAEKKNIVVWDQIRELYGTATGSGADTHEGGHSKRQEGMWRREERRREERKKTE
jgi:hypothetical protein